jgi:hypothetical protein
MNHDLTFASQMDMAQRELGAFLYAVSDSYGPEEADIAAQDWLDELKLLDCEPEHTPRDWRLVTIAAAGRLSKRVNKKTGNKIASHVTSSTKRSAILKRDGIVTRATPEVTIKV